MRLIKNIVRWFKYRLHPKHRYHVLRLHDPGYSDPRHQMILAVMGIAERYVEELRRWLGRDMSHLSNAYVCYEYFEATAQEEGYDDPWALHYKDMYELMNWWDRVKDNDDLDGWRDLCSKEVDEYTVNIMLTKAVGLRHGMWT